MTRCSSYSFPGNVRELENMLERAVDAVHGRHDRRGRHPAARPTARADQPTRRSRRRRHAAGAARSATQLEDIERDAIVRALEQTRYNKTAAAKLLGHDLPRAALSHQEAGHRVTRRRRVADRVTFWADCAAYRSPPRRHAAQYVEHRKVPSDH